MASEIDWATTDNLLTYAIGLDPGKHGKPEQMRVAAIMKTLGWEQQRRRWPDGGREPRWFRPGLTIDDWLATAQRSRQEAPSGPDF
ncbi:hypothetical protein [Stenotrophomonas sp. NPDC077659]